MDKRRILFVDDEPTVLSALRRALISMNGEWDMAFVTSGNDALDLMQQVPMDVVISDMRMPGMDGATLLDRIRELHPQAIRIVLSGHADKPAVMRTIGTTHRYLSKPCPVDELQSMIARACALRDLIGSVDLAQLVSSMDTIPSVPSVFDGLQEELKSSDPSIQRIGEIVSQDPAMAARILQVVNSAYIGLQQEVSNVAHATVLLGLNTVKELVLSYDIFARFDETEMPGFSIKELRRHSRQVSASARAIMEVEAMDGEIVEAADMAGMVHDIGRLLLATNVPQDYARALYLEREEAIPIWQAETEIFGTSHAEIGAYLLGLWGLPDTVVEATAYHHRPSEYPDQALSPVTAVHVADALDRRHWDEPTSAAPDQLDYGYLRALGVDGRLAIWEQRLSTVEIDEAA